MSAKHLVPSQEIFVGRKVELAQFEQAIQPDNKLAALLRGPGAGVQSRVFLPHGIGGMGKTWLGRECLKRAHAAGWATAEIDWDTADTRPTDRVGLMNKIADVVKEEYGERLVREYLATRGRVKQVQERVRRFQKENQKKWQSFIEWSGDMAEGVVTLLDEKRARQPAS